MEKFNTEVIGYNKKEVNKFINEAVIQLDNSVINMKKLEKEVTYLRQELIKYKQMEANYNRSINRNDTLAEEIRTVAKKEAEIILSDARVSANRVVNDALIEANKIELQKDTLERNMRIYKKKLRSIVEQQLDVIEEIEILEL